MAARNDSQTEARDILRRIAPLFEERRRFEPTWEEVADHAGAMWGGFQTETQHPRSQPLHILDSTLAQGAENFAAGMSSGCCGPSQRWCGLEIENPDQQQWLSRRKSGREMDWLQRIEDLYYTVFARSGFYQQVNVAFWQWGLFGWFDLMLDESLLDGPRFSARALPEVWIGQDWRGQVDRGVRRFKMSAEEMSRHFGADDLPEPVRRALDSTDRKERDKPWPVLHVVLPRDGDGPPLREHQRFSSHYIFEGGSERQSQILSEGGYRSNPHLVSRFLRLPSTPYAYSPGMQALPNSRMANEMLRLLLEAGQLSAAPPYWLPDDGVVGRVTYQPRGLNFYRRDANLTAADFRPMELGGDPRFNYELLQATQRDIGSLFKSPLFMTLNQMSSGGQNPTATQITELAGERMYLLTPILVNAQTEFLDPMFENLWWKLLEGGHVPPAPPEVRGGDLRVVYKSPLMRAQQEFRTQAVLKTAQEVGALAALDQEVVGLFDWQGAARVLAEQRGFPADCVRSEEDLRALAQARQRVQAQQQAQAVAGQALASYGDMAAAPEPGSPAEMVMKSFQGGVAQ